LASVIRMLGAFEARPRTARVICRMCPWPFAGMGKWLPWPPLVHTSDARGVRGNRVIAYPCGRIRPQRARTGPRCAGRLTDATAPSPALSWPARLTGCWKRRRRKG
jgi:hypothetical protein